MDATDVTPSELWCVYTLSFGWSWEKYAGNGGFGPVNVTIDGVSYKVEYRHRVANCTGH